MSWLVNTLTGHAVGDLLPDSAEYEFLKACLQPGTGGGTTSSQPPRPLYEEISRAQLEHLIAGDAENQLATVPSLDETGYVTLVKYIGALGAANDVAEQIGTVVEAGNVTTVEYIPAAAVTGAATNTRTLSVVDAGSLGAAGSPPVVASLALVAGVNLAADTENPLTLGTPAVAGGDVLEYKSTHAGTGLADPGGLVIVTINGYAYSAADYSNAGYVDPDQGGE